MPIARALNGRSNCYPASFSGGGVNLLGACQFPKGGMDEQFRFVRTLFGLFGVTSSLHHLDQLVCSTSLKLSKIAFQLEV